jgi:hypothetical protein
MEKNYEEFHATIKLKNSEEIFSLISPSDEGDKTFLVLLNPVTIDEVIVRGQPCYKIDPWLKTTTTDMILIDMDNVLTIVECHDENIIKMYKSFWRKTNSEFQRHNLSRKMGYLNDIDKARTYLEKLYKS